MTRKESNANRAAAIAAGERMYAGTICKRRHVALRYTAGGICVECMRLHGSMRQRDNRTLAVRAWHSANNKRPSVRASRRKQQQTTKARATRKRWQEQNINYKIAGRLRARLYTAIRNNAKAGSAVQDLGCTIEFFKRYIEQQFQPGMTWENWGAWHLDHKRPLAAFDLSIRGHFLQAVHFTNLQPLWAVDNLRKGAQ